MARARQSRRRILRLVSTYYAQTGDARAVHPLIIHIKLLELLNQDWVGESGLLDRLVEIGEDLWREPHHLELVGPGCSRTRGINEGPDVVDRMVMVESREQASPICQSHLDWGHRLRFIYFEVHRWGWSTSESCRGAGRLRSCWAAASQGSSNTLKWDIVLLRLLKHASTSRLWSLYLKDV